MLKYIVDVPLNHGPGELVRLEPDQQLLHDLFAELEFRNMLAKQSKPEIALPKPVNPQGSLFDFSEEPVKVPDSNLGSDTLL